MLAGPWIGILPCRHAVILMYTLPIGRIIPPTRGSARGTAALL